MYNMKLVRVPVSKLYHNLAGYYRLSTGLYFSINSHFSIQSPISNTKAKPKHNQQIIRIHSRKYSVEDNKKSNDKLPALMNFTNITWPSIIKSIRNFVLVTFIIRPYFDKEFTLPDFVGASKTAIEMVSQRIAESDFRALEGLVTPEVITDVQAAISSMSMAQREQVAVVKDDIYFSFPYQVGIMFNDVEGQEQKRFVEITMVYHIMKGLTVMRSRGEEPPLNMGLVPDYQNRLSICNYRFIREFTKGVEPKWTINLLNHFKPVDYVGNR